MADEITTAAPRPTYLSTAVGHCAKISWFTPAAPSSLRRPHDQRPALHEQPMLLADSAPAAGGGCLVGSAGRVDESRGGGAG
jgi:hypothetical protein